MTDGAAVALRGSLPALPNLDRIIRGLLYVFIFSLPFKGLLFLERNGFIILLVLLGIWCAVNRQHFFIRTPVDLPLAAFVLWVGLTIPFAAYPVYSLKEFGKLLQQALIFYTVLFFFRDHTRWVHLTWLLVGVAFAVGVYSLVEFDDTFRGGGSFLRAEVWLTTYLVMMIPVCFALAWYAERPWAKALFALGTLLLTACLLLARSRAGFLAFLVELWAFAWLVGKRSALVLAAGVTLALAAALSVLLTTVIRPDGTVSVIPQTSLQVKTDTKSIVHRFDIWAFVLDRIAEHPVVGIGYGKETSKMLFGQEPEENILPGHAPVRTHGAHNILLELALLVGLPGMIAFVWLAVRLGRTVVAAFRRSEEALARSFLLGMSLSMIGLGVRLQFDQMLVGTVALQFWVMAGIAILASKSSESVPHAARDGGLSSLSDPLPEAGRVVQGIR